MPVYTPEKNIIAGSNITTSTVGTDVTISVTNVGSANGIASLDFAGKVPVTQLPNSIMEYKGNWDASLNLPLLADGTGNAGDTYRVSVAGTQNLGSGSISFEISDYIIYSGSIWQKSDTTDSVFSVNSKVGNVVLNPDDLSDATSTNKFTTASAIARLANTSGTNTGNQNVFSTVAVSGQSNLEADSTSDVLTIVAGTNISLSTNASTDSLTINAIGGGDVTGPASSIDNRVALFNGTSGKVIKDSGLQISGTNTGDQNVFSTITVSGQSNVVADTTSDALELVAGSGIAISTDPINDRITIQNTNPTVIQYTGQGIKNILVNPDFSIAQRIKPGLTISFTSTGTYLNSDDVYNFDRWYLLSDGNNRVNITKEVVDVPIGCPSVCRMTVVATSSPGYKFGQAQIVENANCASFVGYYATLSFLAKVSNATRLDNIRCAIIGWTGTADTVTSDVVSSWGPINTNPTLVANAVYLNTPDNMYIPDSWATDGLGRNIRYAVSCAVPSNVTNLIVLIWNNSQNGNTAGDFVSIADVQLEASDAVSVFERLPVEINYQRCLRYFWGLWARTASQPFALVTGVTSTRMDGILQYPSLMRGNPVVTTSAASTLRVNYGGGSWVITSIGNVTVPTPTAWFFQIGYTTGGITPGFCGIFGDNAVNTSWLHFNAEL